jgi:hypothetical protein
MRARMAGPKSVKVLILTGMASVLIATIALAATYGPGVIQGEGLQSGYGDVGCPPGWDRTAVEDAEARGIDNANDYDENDNSFICLKAVPGRGNTGEGFNARDDDSR